MADRVLQRRDTSANWSSANPILAEGEMGIVTDTRGYKIGDGSTAWNDLEYPSNPTTVVNELGDSSTTAISQEITTDSILNRLDITNIDLDSSTISKLMFATAPTRYNVMSNNKNCGILEVFSDNNGHMLTEVFETHYIVEDGVLTSGHSDDKIFRYKREYHYNGGTSTIPVGTWGEWEMIYSSDNQNDIDTLKNDVENLNANTGISEYETFSNQKAYSTGDTVKYNGLLYTFTTDHVAGAWDEMQVESASLNKSLLKKTNDINNNYKSELGILNIEKGAIYLDSGTFVDSEVRVRTNKIYGAYNIVLNNDYVLHGGCKFDKNGNYQGYYNNLSSSYEDNLGYVYLVFKKKNESEITDLDNIVVEYSINGNYAKFNEYKEYKESTNQQIGKVDEKLNNIQSGYLITSENVNNSFKNKEVLYIADNISIRQNSGVQYINELTALNSDTLYLELKEFDDNIDNYFATISAIGIPSDGTSNIFTSGTKTENNNLKFSFAKKVSKFRCYFNEDDIKKDFYLSGVLYKKNFLDASLIFDYTLNKFQNEINEKFNGNVENQKVLYVSKNTSGFYNTITEAINVAVDNSVIIVLPGEYDETLDLRTKSLSIIGTDKYKCIITRRTEDYGTPPIWMTNSVIENFTIRALRATDMSEDEIWETSAANTGSEAANKIQGNYCIHLDTDGRGASAIRKSIVRNCILISECNDCIGCGAYPDETIEIDSCYCINKNGYMGFDIHVNTNIGYDGVCNVILKNNIFLSYHLGCIQFVYYTENSTPPKSIIDATMINNRALSKDDSEPLNIEGSASSYSFFIKNELSYGNSDVNMNN